MRSGAAGVKTPVPLRTTYLFIPLACGTLYTGLFVTMGGKTVTPIFHFVARQAFSPFQCAFLPPALELFHYDTS